MIEMVYKGNNENETELDKQRLPKNVRQIGEAGKGKKIYLEDYAVTYLHQVESAVLLGNVLEKDGNKYIFIHGAIKVDNPSFGDEIWEDVYREAREYFEDSEILGWAMEVSEQPLVLSKAMNDIYKAHFDREDAVLLLYEPYEKEDGVFVEENGVLKKAAGHYIYYDKNKSMQEYMVFKNEGKSIEKENAVTDKAIKNFRKIAEEKREKFSKEKTGKETVSREKLNISQEKGNKESGKETIKQPKMVRFLYAASTFLVLTILIIGVTMINNYDKMKNMERTISDMTKGTEASIEASAADNILNITKNETEVSKNKVDKKKVDKNSETEGLTEDGTQDATKDTSAPETAALNDGGTSDKANAKKVAAEDGTAPENEKAVDGDLDTAKGEGETTTPADSATSADAAQTPETPIDAAAASTPAVHTEQATYTVKEGDTLADICKMYYGSLDKLDELCSANGIIDPNHILLGQKIKLP